MMGWPLIALAVACSAMSAQGLTDESRLLNHLMETVASQNPYGVIIPVPNTNETQKVSFGLALVSILSIDVDSGTGEFKFWERYTWKDSTLSWDPEEFGGIDLIRIPMAKPVWKPDFVLYNSVTSSDPYSDDVLGVVLSDGTVLYIPIAIRKVRCDVIPAERNSRPQVQCWFKFGSWTFDGNRLDLGVYDDLETIDLNDFVASRRFKITSSSAVKNVKYYPCCMEPYPDLTFSLTAEIL